MRIRSPLFLTLGLLLGLFDGCASIRPPRTMTDGDVSVQAKKRNEEFTKEFDSQRDFAEYEAAKARWLQQRDPKGCQEGLEKLLVRRPKHREARVLLAELLIAEGNPQAANEQAKKALESYPNDAEVQYTVAQTFDALEEPGEAIGYYERAARMDPSNQGYAAAFRAAKEASRAEVGRLKATTIGVADPGDPADNAGQATGHTAPVFGESSVSDRADWNDSEGPATPIGKSESAPVARLLQQGQQALADGSPPKALELFRQAAAVKPENPQIPISAAALALRANHPEVAVELLTPAAKQFSKSAGVFRMLGAAQYRMGDYKSSQVALQQALSLDKSSALSYLLMGCTLAKLGQAEAAETHFREARALAPRYKVVR